MFPFSPARARRQPLPARLDAMLSRSFKADKPGAAIIATRNGETLFRAAYGLADVACGVRLDPGMTFRLGSLTKQFTAVGVMKLAERGKLALRQDIRDYLPSFPDHGHVITIEHLLTHTSGVTDYTGLKDFKAMMANDLSVDAMIDRFQDAPLQFAAGIEIRL